jgi:hypothetical protein
VRSTTDQIFCIRQLLEKKWEYHEGSTLASHKLLSKTIQTKEKHSTPLFFNFALKYAIRKVQENQVRLKLNGAHQLLAYADHMSLL